MTTVYLRMPTNLASVLLVMGALSSVTTPSASAQSVIAVVVATNQDGNATDDWLRLLQRRLDSAPYDSASRMVRPVTTDERAWIALIQSRVAEWEQELPALARHFEPVAPPASVVVFLGNRGASDAFTHDARTIGFDLSALVREYGSAADPANTDRIDRIFRHEYTHLLQKAWAVTHAYAARTPLRAALLDIWAEGLGNYYSMSKAWRATHGTHSGTAAEALARLEPRLVARLAAIACTDSTEARTLTRDLSSGPFAQKWGAVTPALWLELEMSRSPQALRELVLAGPDGVWNLAERHLSGPLRQTLREARAAAEICGTL